MSQHPVSPADDTQSIVDTLTGAFPVVVFELDADGYFIDESGAGVSRVAERYADTGGSSKGQSAFDLYDDAPQVLANLRRALGGEAFSGRVEVPSLDGPAAVFEVVYRPVLDARGHVERLVGVALDVTQRERAARQVVQDAERLRRLAARLQTERETERTRIARAVHDAVGQSLTAIRFDAMSLLRLLDADPPVDRHALAQRLRDVMKLVDTSLDAVGDLASELRPPVLDTLGLSAALADTAARFETRTGIMCVLDRPLGEQDEHLVGQARATTAFRIVQEALTNVARHAGLCTVTLHLRIDQPTMDEHGELPERWGPDSQRLARALVVEIIDDGRGVPDGIAHAGTPGLSGMAERAAQWGGTLYVGPPPGPLSGTLVRAIIPLDPEPTDS